MLSSEPCVPPCRCSDLQEHLTRLGRNARSSLCPAWVQDHHFEGKLSAADVALLDRHINAKPLTADMLLASALSFVETYDRKWFQETLRKLDPLFLHIKSFSSVVDVFVQTNPAIPGLIWGSLHLAITVGQYSLAFQTQGSFLTSAAAGVLSVNESLRNICGHARRLCADPVVL